MKVSMQAWHSIIIMWQFVQIQVVLLLVISWEILIPAAHCDIIHKQIGNKLPDLRDWKTAAALERQWDTVIRLAISICKIVRCYATSDMNSIV